LSKEAVLKAVQHPYVAYVQFTGSVEGGRAVQQACSSRFIGVGLELGGKDSAYVRPDCDLKVTVEELVDGAFFNSGQSCCGVERIYVHEKVYDAFVKEFVALTEKYRLGDPRDAEVTLGPVVSEKAAENIRRHVDEAITKGAKQLVNLKIFPQDKKGTTYVAPHVLANVDHAMLVMTEETFGPIVGIMSVVSDDQAIHLMNDSPYGLTASVWTKDVEAMERMGAQLECGTVYMNRSDHLDPGLAWTGWKDSGRGVTLSRYGFDGCTRVKSYHYRLP